MFCLNNKLIFWIIAIIFLALPVFAIDECKGTMNNNEVPCLVILPVNITTTACNTIQVSFYNASVFLNAQTMEEYSPFSCNATFNYTEFGTYSFNYSTGDTGDIVIEEDVDNRYYLYVIALTVFFILLGIGYFTEEKFFVILAGMLSCVIAINLFLNGFPNLSNEFLKNGIVMIFAGVGFYFILAPSIDYFEREM